MNPNYPILKCLFCNQILSADCACSCPARTAFSNTYVIIDIFDQLNPPIDYTKSNYYPKYDIVHYLNSNKLRVRKYNSIYDPVDVIILNNFKYEDITPEYIGNLLKSLILI